MLHKPTIDPAIGAVYTMCTHSRQHEVLTRLNEYWPALATLAQHLADIGSVSAWTRRQK